ncbi:hypothetical protein T06_12321 [Trichinella sp. T6]|nr:hypothetical protein T06_12321 [Trichinella sp. T6]
MKINSINLIERHHIVLSLPCSAAKVNSVLYIHNWPVVILSPTGRIELIDRITPTSVRSIVSWSLVLSEKCRLASKSSMQNRKHLKIIRHRCGPEQSKVTVRRLAINLAIIKIKRIIAPCYISTFY